MRISQSINIEYEYPVHFLRNIFDISQKCLKDIITEKEPERCHKVCFVLEKEVVDACDNLLQDIMVYCSEHSKELNLVSAPLVYSGGEQIKAFSNLEEFCQKFEHFQLCRQSFLVIIGGGAFLDAVGFAASIFHRGIRHIRVPTTVLAQADSGVGVKNAVNLLQKKNLIGCFYPPYAVINDFNFLDTLPERDWIAGITEAFKVAMIKDCDFFYWLCDNCDCIKERDKKKMEYLVTRCAELHVEHIGTSGDPFEFGSARPLDFGHWLAHRLEMLSKGRLRHGEAVAIGLVVDSFYAEKIGYLDGCHFEKLFSALKQSGFKLWENSLEVFLKDSKLLGKALDEFREHLGGELHITLPNPLGAKIEVNHLDINIILNAIRFLKEYNNDNQE